MRNQVNSATPPALPTMPPASSVSASVTSIALRRQYAIAPEKDEAATCVVTLATATAGCTPMKINSGVIKNPPPTPNMPERNPDRKPHRQHEEDVDGNISDRKVDLHGLSPGQGVCVETVLLARCFAAYHRRDAGAQI